MLDRHIRHMSLFRIRSLNPTARYKTFQDCASFTITLKYVLKTRLVPEWFTMDGCRLVGEQKTQTPHFSMLQRSSPLLVECNG